MALKIVLLCAVVAIAKAGVIETGWQQPNAWNPHTTLVQQPTIIKQVQPAIIKKVAYEEAPANYEFNYEVHDAHTGDIKRQFEKAENGFVSGQYSLVDPDGYRRVVSYTADAHHGFQANVQREPLQHGWEAKPTITKVIQPATLTKVIQPATVTKVLAPAPSHGWQQPAYQAPTVLKLPAASHGWQQPSYQASHGWQQPSYQAQTVLKLPAASHGWQQPSYQASHGWQQPAYQSQTLLKLPAASQGWQQPNPHAANPWG